MPTFSSVNFDKLKLARENHTKLADTNNEKLEAVFNLVARALAARERTLTYKDMAEWLDMDQGRVEYYVKKLKAVGAVTVR